jgi:hypothetical protein
MALLSQTTDADNPNVTISGTYTAAAAGSITAQLGTLPMTTWTIATDGKITKISAATTPPPAYN